MFFLCVYFNCYSVVYVYCSVLGLVLLVWFIDIKKNFDFFVNGIMLMRECFK